MIELVQAKYEKAKQYYEAAGGEDYFEFDFTYVDSGEEFREIDRFLWESKHEKTRFNNCYKGPVLLDITGWNGKELNSYFEAFMYFLKDHGAYECTFIVQEECCKNLKEKLEDFFEIRFTGLEAACRTAAKRTIGFAAAEKEDYNV